MKTMKFLRKLADELLCDVTSLDDDIVEYVLEYVGADNLAMAKRIYDEQEQEMVNP